MNEVTKPTKPTKPTKKRTIVSGVPKPRTIDQLSMARMIAQKYSINVSDVTTIIEAEQKLTMEYVKMGYKVIKKNYLTIESKKYEAKKNWQSPLDGKIYDIAARTRVLVRVGEGFKQYTTDRNMPEKLCRFVSNPKSLEIGSDI